MARDNKESQETEPVKNIEAPDWAKDSRAERIGLDIKAWYKPEVTGSFYGQIVGFQVITIRERGELKDRNIFLVRLGHDALGVGKGFKLGGKEKPVQLVKGDILGVAEREKLKDLRNFVTKHGLVYVKPLEKIALDGGREMWTFECVARGERAELDPLAFKPGRDSANKEPDEADDIPF